MGEYTEVLLCTCSLRDLLSLRAAGKCEEPLLCFPESIRADSLLLRLLYPGDIEGRLLYDYFADFSASRAVARDRKAVAAQTLLLRSDRGVYLLLRIFIEGNVCDGYKIAALPELDL